MFSDQCLNPISKVGLDRRQRTIKCRYNIRMMQSILVRSASMHELELPENLCSGSGNRCRSQQHSSG